ncbi:MAG TPA: hypothetical protein VM073_00405 [Usitatibacter sp.]|nr:hypothetical protein [Usitatibacter sp.]
MMTPNPNPKTEKEPQLGQDQKPSGQQQMQGGEGQQYGEGNYKATRQYNEGMKEHVQHHDVEREARDAAPRSDAEKQEMEAAEREGRSRSKGEDASFQGNNNPGENDDGEK